MTTRDSWNTLFVDQLDWHWTTHLRPRLEGLTDAEYFWEPVPDSWNVRREGEPWSGADETYVQAGTGAFRCDFAMPEPEPAPVTSIAWRLAHLVVGIFGARNHAHFGGPEISYPGFAYAGTAEEALGQLDDGYRRWIDGVRALGEEGLREACGPAEGPFAEHPMSALVLHIHREAIHHGAEVALLRDLHLRH